MDIRRQTIRITVKENYCTEKKYAIKINKWLAVAAGYDTYKIFRIDTGLPLIEAEFESRDKCIEFAQWIAKQYESVMDVWEAWQDCDLLRIAQYTIPNGVEVYNIIEKVSSQQCLS